MSRKRRGVWSRGADEEEDLGAEQSQVIEKIELPPSPVPIAASTTSTETAPRGYLAKFNWASHYPVEAGAEISSPIKTDIYANLPGISHCVIEHLQKMEVEHRGRSILEHFDPRICRAWEGNQESINPNETCFGMRDETNNKEFVVVSNRRDHIRLFYEAMQKLEICPYAIRVRHIASGVEYDLSQANEYGCTCNPPPEVMDGPSEDEVESVGELEREAESHAMALDLEDANITGIWEEVEEAITNAKTRLEDNWNSKLDATSEQVQELEEAVDAQEEELEAAKEEWMTQVKASKELWSHFIAFRAQVSDLSTAVESRSRRKRARR